MDTTKKTIKMFREAWEIQELYNSDEYNFLWHEELVNDWDRKKFVYSKYNKKVMLHFFVEKDDCGRTRSVWSCWWLPYQDQLQEMVAETSGFDGKRMIGLELCNFWAWYQQNRPGDIGVEMKLWPSWEQLWLKFVMKIKYNKLWDDKKEKWIE